MASESIAANPFMLSPSNVRSSFLIVCLAIAVFGSLNLFIAPGAFAADEEFRLGVAHIKKRQYPQAVKFLGICLKKNPRDYRACYFLGICYEKVGDIKSASTMFSRAMLFGYKTSVYDKACTHLQRVNPSAYVSAVAAAQSAAKSARLAASGSRPGASASSPSAQSRAPVEAAQSYDSLPFETQIHYEEEPDSPHQIVNASVNNRPIKMLWDTGAEGCVFGKIHLDSLGIAEPKGKPTGYSHGVGDGGAQATWSMRVTLKVGSIERKNFLISYIPGLTGEPLLGQTFFRDFHYTIDDAGKTIHFIRNDRTGVRESIGSVYAGSNDNRYEVPFTNEGNDIVVDVEVNGRTIPMFFDTGASVVLFGPMHLKQLGLTVPSNARTGMSEGVQGESTIFLFPVRSMHMGPIEHRNFEVAVDPGATISHPLLGQTFFKDYRYSIDNVNKVIKLERLR